METNAKYLENLKADAAALSEIQSDIAADVWAARETGASWAAIGRALGISKQAAQQKYGKEIRTGIHTLDDYTPAQIVALAETAPPTPEPLPAAKAEPPAAKKGIIDYRTEDEMLRFSKQTQRFVGLAEKRGLSYEIHVSPPISDEPKHQLTITVRDPRDHFHNIYWIQTAGIYTWSSKRPNHSLSYATGAGRHVDVPQNRAALLMDGFLRPDAPTEGATK